MESEHARVKGMSSAQDGCAAAGAHCYQPQYGKAALITTMKRTNASQKEQQVHADLTSIFGYTGSNVEEAEGMGLPHACHPQ